MTKIKNIKLNQIDRVNLLADTFQPITKPFKNIIGKLEDKHKDMTTLLVITMM